jgi:hypothetical protein
LSDSAAPSSKKLGTDFVPIEDTKEALAFLKDAVASFSAVMLWTKDQKRLIETHLAMVSDVEKTLYIWVPPAISPKDFAAGIAESGVPECYFSVSAPRANIFFKTGYTGHDDGGLKFSLPEKVFKVQRRQYFRFQIPEGHVLRVEFDDPIDPAKKMQPKVLDISAGGLAFLVGETEEPLFPVGTVLKNVTFTIRGRKFQVDAEVRHKHEMPDHGRFKGHKVGVLFAAMSAADNQHLVAYVFEESRKYFSRFA